MKAKISLQKISMTLLMIVFIAGLSFGQQNSGNLKGVVSVSGSSTPLSGAEVKIQSEKNTKWIRSLTSDKDGKYEFKAIPAGKYYFTVYLKGYKKYRKSHVEILAGKTKEMNVPLHAELDEVVLEEKEVDAIQLDAPVEKNRKLDFNSNSSRGKKQSGLAYYANGSGNNSSYTGGYDDNVNHNTESYASIEENGFKSSKANPLSTFSVDVDAASYSNCRRFILSGQKPEKGAVRVEEMINYFNYDYPDPTDEHPFSISTEVGDCPWSDNKLVHIGLQGKRIEKENLPDNNLVFLLDVSGSMNRPNKLPLLKKSFRLLVDELDSDDKISMVVYAGAAGLVLKPTAADNSTAILEALDNLRAGGSTAGGAGIELAYKVAQDNFIDGGNNRVILATDGDFNIGMSSDAAMQKLIEEKRKTGIFLTCLGFGTGNYKDSKMEILADKGNGNYAYIDNLLEAKKVLVTEIGATLNTLAKDVKIQVEFNPNVIESYRLVGYENRLLAEEDFNDDTKDAGEIGAGHSVTALYEVVLKGEGNATTEQPNVDPLKYQTTTTTADANSDEMLTVKFRYKAPDGDKSKLIERTLANKITPDKKLSRDFNFSAAVAEFGMLLGESKYKGTGSFDHVLELASKNMGKDKNGYRAEFLKLVDAAKVVYN
ncbi:MAG: von Willebrand factor type A domain-containing protein [Crocinitomicaceae bacterium]|nr:von Willebrand factor type A domain-containing protein [Crocinitomicaceae bacterium]